MTLTKHKKFKSSSKNNTFKKCVLMTSLLFFSTSTHVFSSDMPFTTLKYPEPGSFAKKEKTDAKVCFLFLCKEVIPVVTKTQLSK